MLPIVFADGELMKIVADDMERAYRPNVLGEPVAVLKKQETPLWFKAVQVVAFSFILYNVLKK